MKTVNYSEKLNHPRWQKKRLEKMQAAGWKCEICGDAEEQLHVHHKLYRDELWRGGPKPEPWDYELYELLCVCDTCHTIIHWLRPIRTWMHSFQDERATQLATLYLDVRKECETLKSSIHERLLIILDKHHPKHSN